MPDARAARCITRRFAYGAVAAVMAMACAQFAPAAFAVGGAPPVGVQPRAPSPGHPPPAARTDRSEGTTASGPVRAQPPRMPFYVATKGQTTLYLLGTLHVGYPSDYPPEQPYWLLQGHNLWPDESMPELKEAAMAWAALMSKVGAELMRAIAVSLEQPETYFEEPFRDTPAWMGKLVHYVGGVVEASTSKPLSLV